VYLDTHRMDRLRKDQVLLAVATCRLSNVLNEIIDA